MALTLQGKFPQTTRGCVLPIGAAIALALLGGCTTQLKSVHLRQDAVAPQAGIPYNLTFTQFTITLERSITACPGVDGKTQVEIGADFSFSSVDTRDPDHEYALDMNSLRSFFKTTEISVAYHANGALASINAKAKDETGAVVTSVAGTLSKLLVASAGVPVPAAPAPMIPGAAAVAPAMDCSDASKKALAAIPKLTASLSKATQDMNDATADLASMTKLAEASGSRSRSSWQPDLTAALNELKSKRAAMRVAQKAVDDAQKLLTFKPMKAVWPTGSNSTFTIDAAFRPLERQDDSTSAKLIGAAMSGLEGNQAYWLALNRQTIGWTSSEQAATGTPPVVEGIRYRKAMPGWLTVYPCAPVDESKSKRCAASDQTPLQLITQLGPIFALPLKNYPFMVQSVSAEFNEAGQPVKLGYFSEATAGKLASTLDGVADQWLKVKEARKPKSELDEVNDQLALLTAKNNLAAAQKVQAGGLDTDVQATAAAKAKAALFDAQLAQLKAEKALLEFSKQGG